MTKSNINDFCLAYVTTKDKAQALTIGRALVERKLAACINVLPQMTSLYRWQGAIEEADEAVLVVKTKRHLVESVTATVKALHSYEVPCLLVVPLVDGSADYLEWLERQLVAK